MLDLGNTFDRAKIRMKLKNDMDMSNITMAFEMNTTINDVNKYKSSDWLNGLAWELLEELRKLAHPQI